MRPDWSAARATLNIGDALAEQALEDAAEIRTFPRGAMIIAQDDDEDQVYILLYGQARVVLFSEDGQEIWLDSLKTGSVLGEIAALTKQRRTSGIIAERRSIVAALSSDVFFELARQHGAIGIMLARILAHRVHHTTQRMFELSALSAPGRVYAEILRLAEPTPDRPQRAITPTPSLTAIARRINTTRETVSRTVSDLERRGLLRRVDDGFELVDPDQILRLLQAG